MLFTISSFSSYKAAKFNTRISEFGPNLAKNDSDGYHGNRS